MRIHKIVLLTFSLGLLNAFTAIAQEINPEEMQDAIGRTPPRLSFVDGQVSFWRPGTENWINAQLNTPLALGDQLSVGPDGNLELQIGARAFVRGGAGAQITLERQEPDFLQFKVKSGSVAFDMRQVEPGRMVAVQTPHSANFTMEDEGYFRLDVEDGAATFTSRRSGRAKVVVNDNQAIPIRPNESVTITGKTGVHVTSQGAPALDPWDRWNYERTDQFLAAASHTYVPSEVYGLNDLEHHGTWLVTSAYGPVWRPHGVAVGWVPYSTGAWINDPYYGWTWVDTAPWGWAPYHYGRWVYVNNYWCWAPGPRVVQPVYAPALVAFYGQPGVQISIGINSPVVGWVALGWGEPLVPWWGSPGFIHRPWWGGWGGPHCLNGRVISHGAVVNVSHINVYQNMHQHHAMVVDQHSFGHGPTSGSHLVHSHANHLRPLHGAPHVVAPHMVAPHGHVQSVPHHDLRPPVKPAERKPYPHHGKSGVVPPAQHQPRQTFQAPQAPGPQIPTHTTSNRTAQRPSPLIRDAQRHTVRPRISPPAGNSSNDAHQHHALRRPSPGDARPAPSQMVRPENFSHAPQRRQQEAFHRQTPANPSEVRISTRREGQSDAVREHQPRGSTPHDRGRERGR